MKSLHKAFCVLCLLLQLSVAAAQMPELPDFTGLVEAQGATVVNISTMQPARGNRNSSAYGSNGSNGSTGLYGPFGRQAFDENDPAFEFFRRFVPPNQAEDTATQEMRALGSGFIISADGHILTNAHVVAGASEILVKLADKRELRGRLLGADMHTDVALIKVDALGLPVVRLGDPGRLKVGEWVVAIGSPFGFENSVTAGIISAKSRLLSQESFVPFIQTNAAINPGNSGGPLFNMRGEVVGINSQIYSRSGANTGLAFAVPIDVAMAIQAQLKSHGRIVRGRIGVVMRDINKELADSFGLIKAQGVLIDAVEQGGAADRAGIVAGDVVLRMNGALVRNSAELQRMVGATRPATAAVLQVWRKGAMQDFSVTVVEVQEGRSATSVRETADKSRNRNPQTTLTMAERLGLQVAEPGAVQQKKLRLATGLLLTDVQGSAATAGLRAGDIILSLVAKGVTSEIRGVQQFNALLEKAGKNASITLRVMRGESQTFVSLKDYSQDSW
ncbi:MAG: Do family serine endopeptidase [Sterolibacterium sp.]|nr:Do family serine endopeptidase [Sterolibacterium sp.]